MEGAFPAIVRLLLLNFFFLNFSAFAAQPPDCVTLLVSPPKNPAVIEFTTAVLSEHSTGKKIFAIGAVEELRGLMAALGLPEFEIAHSSGLISSVFGVVLQEKLLKGTAIERVVMRLIGALKDPAKLTLCLLDRECTFSIGRDAHVFSSRTVHMTASRETRRGSQTVDYDSKVKGLPDPVQLIIFHHKTLSSSGLVLSFFHEGSHFEVSAVLFDWLKANEKEIRRGNRHGLFAFIKAGSDGLEVDEGFATVLFESQAGIVELEMEGLADFSSDLEMRKAKRLVEELRELPQAARFMQANGLNETNIFNWSRQTMETMLPRSKKNASRSNS
jgi:hypothetical protein